MADKKKKWLDLLLQYSIPVVDARNCIQDAKNEEELISNLNRLGLSKSTQRLRHVLSFSPGKRLWLNVLLRHGLEVEPCKKFLLNFKGEPPELVQTLRQLPIKKDLAESIIAQVC